MEGTEKRTIEEVVRRHKECCGTRNGEFLVER